MQNDYIEIINASEHNLKNVSVRIPRNKLVIITGLSGSGKSSLAFDTLYAEGQRRYVESLSAYARQFLGRIKKPAVEKINGLPPAIAIQQKTTSSNSRSTVGTATEIYDYLKLLFARIGRTYSPVSGKEVKRHTADDVVRFVLSLDKGTKILILAPQRPDLSPSEQIEIFRRQGFLRIEAKFTDNSSKTLLISDIDDKILSKIKEICLVVDRIKVSDDEDNVSRIADSVSTAFFEGGGTCRIKAMDGSFVNEFSNRFEADGIKFEPPSLNMFNFNSPLGACKTCNGFGTIIGIDENLVIPNKNLSIYDEAIACWRGQKLQYYKNLLIKAADKNGIPIHKPYKDLTDRQKEKIWHGGNGFVGIYEFFKMLEREQHKIQNRVLIARYRGRTVCPDCKGTRLRKDAGYVKINGKSIIDLLTLEIKDVKKFFDNLKLTEHEQKIAKHLLFEIKNRLDYLYNVGLEYLTLNRASNTLSGGEMQRINLATALGSSLVGSLYILDEPTIGLHPRDTAKLVAVLRKLQQIGNTVIVVEHDQQVIEVADHIIDLGPFAGTQGGKIVFNGPYEQLKNAETLTALYISGKKQIEIPAVRRKPSGKKGFIKLTGVRQNNLKNIDVEFPLGLLIAVTGVSGSGKSSLIKDVLFPALLRSKQIYSHAPGQFDRLEGDTKKIDAVEFVDQNPIGQSTRSNPATYIKAYDDIRKLFASQNSAKINGLTPAHFSFNTDGGRCEECKGEGVITIEMQFMADVTMVCESCKGKRFKDEVLEVTFKGKNIYDVLEMTVDQAIEFFSAPDIEKSDKRTAESIVGKLQILSKVGLGYVKLGQSTSTLSGGESQRLKLASFIARDRTEQKTFFIFDEPTTGLHFDDVHKLLKAFNELVNNGNTVLFIEHNLDMIKSADYVIDLGPEGGEKGGEILFAGTPEELIDCKKSHTAKFLKQLLRK